MFAVGMAPTPEVRYVVRAQVDAVKRSLSPWSADYGYPNFAERPVDSRTLYEHEYTHRRLEAIKAQYDPEDVIQANHPIRPAG